MTVRFGEEWLIDYELQPQGVAAVVSGMRIRPAPIWQKRQSSPGRTPRGGITSTLLHQMSVLRHLKLVAEADDSFQEWIRGNVGGPRQRAPRARSAADRKFLEGLARNYSRLVGKGKVLQRLLPLYRGRFTETQQIAEEVRRARRAGFLTGTRRGVPGGTLTVR